MTIYCDSNFGTWQGMDDPDMVDFYHQVQAESVWKICSACGNRVKLRPDYGICDGCATALENGGDPYV